MKKFISRILISLMLVFIIFTCGFAKDKVDVIKVEPDNSKNSQTIHILTETLNQISNTSLTSAKLIGEQINWQVISGGATDGSSANYKLLGTVGQTAVGSGTSVNYITSHGYWQDFSSSSAMCCDISGDANNDGIIGISDLTYFVDYMFNSGPAPVCFEEFDNNSDCISGISDLTYFVDYMFNYGPPPEPCHLCG
ncbi:MAG: hypothetical protein U9N54_13100 [candidate division Zixibacteria bacterium]|nr:hypothetical protein [candidate division Zixibacteria bacterium]